ncbi:hypothetical protein [Marmoricola sp. RAF53]|uniref:hypothetical protein n=1 Tax=Marmoricola sp. RAF53 TaxID=3233059 RepID=UPI003F95A14B
MMGVRRRARRPVGIAAEPAEALPEELPGPTYRTSAYTVFPTGYDGVDDPARSRWCLTVADAGDGWVIRRQGECLDIFNKWQREQALDSRDAEFQRTCVYNEHAALLRARRMVDRLDVGGVTFEEFVWRVTAGPPGANACPREDAADCG